MYRFTLILLIHSSAHGPLDCFSFFACSEEHCYERLCASFCADMHFHFSLVSTQEENDWLCGNSVIWGPCRLFSTVTAPFHIPTRIVGGSDFSTSSPTLYCPFQESHPSTLWVSSSFFKAPCFPRLKLEGAPPYLLHLAVVMGHSRPSSVQRNYLQRSFSKVQSLRPSVSRRVRGSRLIILVFLHLLSHTFCTVAFPLHSLCSITWEMLDRESLDLSWNVHLTNDLLLKPWVVYLLSTHSPLFWTQPSSDFTWTWCSLYWILKMSCISCNWLS